MLNLEEERTNKLAKYACNLKQIFIKKLVFFLKRNDCLLADQYSCKKVIKYMKEKKIKGGNMVSVMET